MIMRLIERSSNPTNGHVDHGLRSSILTRDRAKNRTGTFTVRRLTQGDHATNVKLHVQVRRRLEVTNTRNADFKTRRLLSTFKNDVNEFASTTGGNNLNVHELRNVRRTLSHLNVSMVINIRGGSNLTLNSVSANVSDAQSAHIFLIGRRCTVINLHSLTRRIRQVVDQAIISTSGLGQALELSRRQVRTSLGKTYEIMGKSSGNGFEAQNLSRTSLPPRQFSRRNNSRT